MRRSHLFDTIQKRLSEPRRFIEVLAGPRQTGKTTLVRQVIEASHLPNVYASADEPTLRDRVWIEQQWDAARLKVRQNTGGVLLVLDEVQKVTGWSETVKHLWDSDSQAGLPLRVVLLGSAPLLIHRGLTESLAGRFEIIPVPHWSFAEMREAFGWDLEQYIFYGGYPGAAGLVTEPERWRRYIVDSLIETTLSRDILLLTRVDKPALLRRLFHLGCAYSGQILSYQKMLGQLVDAGNTVTLAHYLELLSGAGMVTGLSKYAHGEVRQRASSPKLQVLNTALMTALDNRTFDQARQEGDYWGRLVESAVGAHLANTTRGTSIEVHYWRERNQEVDFILEQGDRVVALEVKSGRRRDALPGLPTFLKRYKPTAGGFLIGGQSHSLEESLSVPASHWVS